MKLFLDDIRQPQECVFYMHRRIGTENPVYLKEWNIVRNYDEFVEAIKQHYKDITHVSFDHDLAEIHYDPSTWTEGFHYNEKTGLDCAKFMKEFYAENDVKLPKLYVHSMNPVGTENIIKLFNE